MTNLKCAFTADTFTDPVEQPKPSALDKIRQFVEEQRKHGKISPDGFEQFERKLHAHMMEVERELLSARLSDFDLDAEAIVVDDKVHRRALRQTQTYQTSAGTIEVTRTLYRDRSDGESRCVSPMELKAGIIGGFWSRSAAKQALWVVTQMTPYKAEELFERLGNMTPSKSSLDRLPKLISERWQDNRKELEQALREGLKVPEATVSVAVSLDGVYVPMDKTDWTPQMWAAAKAQAGTGKGPSAYREVGCATICFCDGDGQMLGAVRMARAPEPNKASLKKMLVQHLTQLLRLRPDLELVKIADGAADNWSFLDSKQLPAGPQVLDFFHASQHLNEALVSVYGSDTAETKLKFEQLRATLRYDKQGAAKVRKALQELTAKHPNNKSLQREQEYFKKHKKRMNYACLAEKGMMIGSGVVEAACKTLVTQRLKQSGMRWSTEGTQAILTPRGWDQSDRFDQAWALVAASFEAEVTVIANVIALKPDDPRLSRKIVSR